MKKELEIYIHIPFCVRKCKYCDFLSAPLTMVERDLYVGNLVRKIKSYEELAQKYLVSSLFIGGGTPSLLTGEQMDAVFQALYETFDFMPEAEITVEMNPGTVSEEKLLAYKRNGINRLSIGLQSANNHELELLGRIHTYEDFLKTYELARKTGFENINIDLMSAIPDQTLESYQETLRKIVELNPEHISAYSLIIEEGTPFFELYGEKSEELCQSDEEKKENRNCLGRQDTQAPLPDEDTERAMYQLTKDFLKKYGYERYEISNYAKAGFECRHNIGYWQRKEYLGIGFGAASLLESRRYKEPDDFWDFCDVEIGFVKAGPYAKTAENLSQEDEMAEFMFLGLRMMEGVTEEAFLKAFHKDIKEIYGKQIEGLKSRKLLEERQGRYWLTERGIEISNYALSEFLL